MITVIRLKNVFLISLLMLFMIVCLEDCKSPVAPDNPLEPPEEVEYHDYWIEYVITEDMIKNHNIGGSYKTADLIVTYYSGVQEKRQIRLEKKNKYLFIGELNQVPCKPSYDNRVFDFFMCDMRRVPSGADWHIPFGDIFILEEKQTGTRTRLTYVIENYHYDGKGKMARCRILHDGSVSNTR